jgi:ABC-type multidrug transport system ATPase subunit
MLELRNISKSYGRVKAVLNQNLAIDSRSALCIVERNGSGKSTLHKIAALLILPDAGSVILDGRDLASDNLRTFEEARRMNIGYSFQEPLLIPYLTALENTLVASSKVSHEVSEDEAVKLLSAFGLSQRMGHVPSKLSGGEKKKVDLARALLRRPRILVADEPLSSIDPDSANLVVRILESFVHDGGSLIYSAVDPVDSRWAGSTSILGA